MGKRKSNELVHVVSLLPVRDALHEYGRQERAKELSEERVERVEQTTSGRN